MKREITFGQLISVAVTVILALATGWITQNNKVSTLQEQVRQLQNDQYNMQISTDKKFDKIDNKLDDNSSTLSDIKVLLERKADRR
jgi:uncharacterized membrane protein (DUF106 family)